MVREPRCTPQKKTQPCCPLCGKTLSNRRKAQAHATVHTTGKQSSLLRHDGISTNNAIFMEVIRALYDNDVLMGQQPGSYGAHTIALIASWLGIDMNTKMRRSVSYLKYGKWQRGSVGLHRVGPSILVH